MIMTMVMMTMMMMTMVMMAMMMNNDENNMVYAVGIRFNSDQEYVLF